MAEYFGFEIEESHDGEFEGLVDGVDPKYHRAIAWGLSQLCQWYGDKAYRQLDEWFTVVYGTILMVEDSLDRRAIRNREPFLNKLNFEDLVEKPYEEPKFKGMFEGGPDWSKEV